MLCSSNRKLPITNMNFVLDVGAICKDDVQMRGTFATTGRGLTFNLLRLCNYSPHRNDTTFNIQPSIFITPRRRSLIGCVGGMNVLIIRCCLTSSVPVLHPPLVSLALLPEWQFTFQVSARKYRHISIKTRNNLQTLLIQIKSACHQLNSTPSHNLNMGLPSCQQWQRDFSGIQ